MGKPMNADSLATLTIEPPPAARISGITRRLTK
jgi:hypothetical protein